MIKRYQIFVTLAGQPETTKFWGGKVGEDYGTIREAILKVHWKKESITGYFIREIYVAKEYKKVGQNGRTIR